MSALGLPVFEGVVVGFDVCMVAVRFEYEGLNADHGEHEWMLRFDDALPFSFVAGDEDVPHVYFGFVAKAMGFPDDVIAEMQLHLPAALTMMRAHVASQEVDGR